MRFRNHEIVGDIVELAARYCGDGADELVFYDITASPDGRSVDRDWVSKVAAVLDIPFSVAGGIRTLRDAEDILKRGADKISVNSPALERPQLINELARRFGSQCVVIGVDSHEQDGQYHVFSNTGDPAKTAAAGRETIAWIYDYVVATGEAHSVREFLETAFSYAGLDYDKYVEIDPRYFRPTEVDHLLGDATKAREKLGWSPQVNFEQLTRMMVDHDMELARQEKTLKDAGHSVATRGKAAD